MKLLITGSNGFLGRNIVKYIIDHFPGWNLTCLVRSQAANIPGVRFVKWDLVNPIEITEAFDVVVHIAGCPSSRECIQDPSLGMNNIIHTFNILELCRKNKIPKLLFFSSCEVYGKGGESLKETDILNSVNMYGASKVAGEHMCAAYSSSYGIECAALRIMNTWGDWCQEDRFASIVQKAFKEQERPHFIIQSTARKRWIHVSDLCEKTVRLIQKELPEKFTVFNVAGDENLTLEEFIGKFGTNFSVEYKIKPFVKGYEPGFNADGSKLAHFLNDASHVGGVKDDPSTNDDIST